MQSVVSIVVCRSYAIECVERAVADAVELAGLGGAFPPGASVLLKPNLLSARGPGDAVTTHPAVVQALGKLAQARGAEVSVGDSPPFAGESAARYARLVERTGMSAAARALDVPVVRFEDDVVSLANPNGRYYRGFEIAGAVMRAEVVASIPKLKTHGLTLFTGAVKNVFGCVPGIRKGLFHAQAAEDRTIFAQLLVDLLGLVRPAVNVMDAVVGMDGEGPNSGTPRDIGLILASSDAVALDAVACAVVGIDPLSIDTTRLAHDQGLGCGDLSLIEVRGESIERVLVSGFRLSSGVNEWARIPGPIRGVLRRQLVASPRFSGRRCVGCGDCARVCPVQAITPGKPPSVDLAKCIRCYCCHEVCDASAVRLRRGWAGEAAFRLLGARRKR